METLTFDLDKKPLREINQFLHGDASTLNGKSVVIENPNGAHNIAVGLKADLNLIDFDRLKVHVPSVAHDLPAGGRRLRQTAEGYVATLVSGVVTYRDGQPTGALPGKLVRGPQSAPQAMAA